ncbi:hypothetical protein QJS10_CPA09g01978 [Acorus calamus]|uniref:hAT-like transposase RNase-H fold domain-containing protein n=1 Tax=Acorus calamus TaxID=4465 RepID=A0AAV9E657_ACOCL|nr:hypothetical protein QJS10_CPA09g01978 [Acorus calamus]
MRLLTCGKKKERTAYPGGFQYDERKSRLELVRMIIYHEYPFDIVEHVGFRRFIQSLCPFFNMMSHNDIKNDCMVFYEKEKKRIYDALDKIFSRAALEYKDAFIQLSSRDPEYTKLPSEEQWEQASTFCSLLKHLASFLDPQYKMKLMECYYPQIFGSDAEDRVKEILDIVKSLYEVYASNMASSLDNCNGHAAESIGSGGSSGTPCQSSSGDGREGIQFFNINQCKAQVFYHERSISFGISAVEAGLCSHVNISNVAFVRVHNTKSRVVFFDD